MKNEEAIREQAREILNKFSESLKDVSVKEKSLKEEVGGFREEGSGENCDSDFREAIFENAPESEGDFLISEKKKW